MRDRDGMERSAEDGRFRQRHCGGVRTRAGGSSGTLSAKAMGARVIATDVVPERLELALELGADHVINSRDTDAAQAIGT